MISMRWIHVKYVGRFKRHEVDKQGEWKHFDTYEDAVRYMNAYDEMNNNDHGFYFEVRI